MSKKALELEGSHLAISPVKISWTDLAGPRPSTAAADRAAGTAADPQFSASRAYWSSKKGTNYDGLNFKITLTCHKTLSWHDVDKETDDLLKHEQLHYNISVLAMKYACRSILDMLIDDKYTLATKVSDLKGKDAPTELKNGYFPFWVTEVTTIVTTTIDVRAEEIFTSHKAAAKKFNDFYDAHTDHGRVKANQSAMNSVIASILADASSGAIASFDEVATKLSGRL